MSLAGGGPRRPVLPVSATVAETYQRVARSLPTFAFLAALPAVLRFASEIFVWTAFPVPPSALTQITLLLLTTFLMSTFSVAWHRYTLLGTVDKQQVWQFVFERREALFFLYSLALMIPVMLAALSAESAPQEGSLLPPVLMGLAVFVFLRLSMLLPAIAVDGDTDPRRAWRLTRGHFWRLFAIMTLVALPAELAALLVLVVLSSHSAIVMVLARAVAIVLEFLITAIVVTALSLVYRRLAGPPDQAVANLPGSPGAAA